MSERNVNTFEKMSSTFNNMPDYVEPYIKSLFNSPATEELARNSVEAGKIPTNNLIQFIDGDDNPDSYESQVSYDYHKRPFAYIIDQYKEDPDNLRKWKAAQELGNDFKSYMDDKITLMFDVSMPDEIKNDELNIIDQHLNKISLEKEPLLDQIFRDIAPMFIAAGFDLVDLCG